MKITMHLLRTMIPITNLLLSAYNFKYDSEWFNRSIQPSKDCMKNGIIECVMKEGPLSDLSVLSIQIIALVFQATLAANYFK